MPLRKSSLRVEVPSGRGVRPTKEVQKRGRTLHSKVKALTEQVKKLDGATYRDKELTEADSILTADVTSLRKSMDKAKADAIKEYKDSHPFFNLLGSQYGEGFEDFRKQAVVLFPNVDISSVQIKLTVPSTPRVDDEVVDVKDRDEDAPEHVMAPQVVQGDGPPQAEKAMGKRDNTDPTA